MNLKDRKSITEISKELEVSPITLKKKLEENNIKFEMGIKKPMPGRKQSIAANKFMVRTVYGDKVKEIKTLFKEGMFIQVKLLNSKECQGQCYRLVGKVKIRSLYENFILIEKEVEGLILRESISFKEIYTEDIELKVC